MSKNRIWLRGSENVSACNGVADSALWYWQRALKWAAVVYGNTHCALAGFTGESLSVSDYCSSAVVDSERFLPDFKIPEQAMGPNEWPVTLNP